MLKYFLFSFLFILKNEIICIDIKVSLGKQIGNKGDEVYPVSLTLNEPLLNKINPIDLFVVFDISSKMNIFHLKRLLNLIVDALDSKDKLSLIPFTYSKTIDIKASSLTEMNGENKESFKEKIGTLKNYKSLSNQLELGPVIKSFFKDNLKNQYDKKRVQSVIFISTINNTDQDLWNTLKVIMVNYNYSDFTLHTISFAEESKGSDLFHLSNFRDGSYYSIKGFIEAKTSVLNIISGLKTTKYKNVKINVKVNSKKFNIRTIFGYYFISNKPKIIEKESFDIEILQFITGKEYTYVFLVDNLQHTFKNGESILSITLEYNDFNGDSFHNGKILYYYNSVKYFDPRKVELCRVRVFEAIYNYINNEIDINVYYERIEGIRGDCEQILNRNFTDLMYDVYNIIELEKNKNWIFRSISEGYLKRGGINLWYSNSYQLEFIKNNSKYEY